MPLRITLERISAAGAAKAALLAKCWSALNTMSRGRDRSFSSAVRKVARTLQRQVCPICAFEHICARLCRRGRGVEAAKTTGLFGSNDNLTAPTPSAARVASPWDKPEGAQHFLKS